MKFAIFLLTLGLTHGLASADSLLPADALRYLIDRKEAAGTQAATTPKSVVDHAQTPQAGRRQEVLRPNETLDSLIKRTWPGLPSKEMWVRKAFVELNSRSFVQGNPNLLQPGAQMVIPSREDLRANFAASHPQLAALFDTPPHKSVQIDEPMPQPGVPHKWIRYP
jgi:Tfp pilus assembly protein FimV